MLPIRLIRQFLIDWRYQKDSITNKN